MKTILLIFVISACSFAKDKPAASTLHVLTSEEKIVALNARIDSEEADKLAITANEAIAKYNAARAIADASMKAASEPCGAGAQLVQDGKTKDLSCATVPTKGPAK